jgi:hypothetical protein
VILADAPTEPRADITLLMHQHIQSIDNIGLLPLPIKLIKQSVSLAYFPFIR